MTQPPSFMPLAIFGAVAVATISRIVDLKLRAHTSAVVVQGGTDARALLEKVFALSILGATAFALVRWLWPSFTDELGSIPLARNAIVAWAGVVIAWIGTLLVAAAQISMASSWRIGVPAAERNPLVTRGLYRFSRNPIYVGMIAIVLGIFLMVPDAVTLALLGVACVSVSIQMRIEEAYLRGVHGEAFDAYCARTRRWV
jgi:protein-S-isoprenylcysteine O-methyltransferase Ste14